MESLAALEDCTAVTTIDEDANEILISTIVLNVPINSELLYTSMDESKYLLHEAKNCIEKLNAFLKSRGQKKITLKLFAVLKSFTSKLMLRKFEKLFKRVATDKNDFNIDDLVSQLIFEADICNVLETENTYSLNQFSLTSPELFIAINIITNKF